LIKDLIYGSIFKDQIKDFEIKNISDKNGQIHDEKERPQKMMVKI